MTLVLQPPIGHEIPFHRGIFKIHLPGCRCCEPVADQSGT